MTPTRPVLSVPARPLLALALSLLLGAVPAGAVVASPTALYVDAHTRSAALTLYNPGSETEEVEVSFAFGYPRSDEDGTVSVTLADTAGAGEPSLLPWLRAFPRRLRLGPGERQTIRVLVQPPADLPRGEYWGRVRIASVRAQPPVEQRAGEGVGVSVSVRTVLVLAISYRNGPLTTSVSVRGGTARAHEEGARLTLDLERGGSAAYLGTIRAALLDPGGRVVAEVAEPVAVYRGLRRVLVLPWGAARPASLAGYTVRYVLSTERPDLPEEALLRAPAVSGLTPLLL